MADYEDDDAEEPDESESKEDEIVEDCREEYDMVIRAEQKQRDRENEALRFQVPELQWTQEERSLRQAQPSLGITARPTLSISLIDQPRQLLINQMRQADLGVEIHPVSEDADQDTAEVIQGLYRHIERKSRAELARAWAFERAVAAGRGCYRICLDWDEEGGDKSDQKISIKRILHQESVYFDPTAEEPDWSDAKFVLVCNWLTKEEFKRHYPKAKASTNNGIWSDVAKNTPNWVDGDDVLVVERWYKEIEVEKFKGVDDEEYERENVRVFRCLLNGYELLEKPVEWPTPDIPIIPVVGREVVPFDEERRWMGLIEPAMDAQKFSNAAASSFVERMFSEPKAPWVGPAEVFAGYEDYYTQSAVRNFSYLPYKTVMKDGQLLPAPQRMQIDLQGASLAAQGLQIAQGWVQTSTAVFDPSLGRLPEKDRSGKAIMALQSQADAGTGHFLANLVDISMTCEAKQILRLIPKVYSRPARVTRILTGDERKAEPVMLNAKFYIHPTTKRPTRFVQPKPPMNEPPQPAMPMQPSMAPPPGPPQGMPASMPPPGMMQRPPVPPQPDVKHYDLTKGVYGVAVSIGKSFQTNRQEGFEKLSEFLGAEPQLFIALGDILLKYAEWPGSREAAKRMVKLRDSQMPFLRDDAEGGPGPDQLKAQMQQMQQQGQQQAQALQQAIQVIQSKQAEQAAKIEVAQINAQAQLQMHQMDNETKMAIAGLQAQFMGEFEKVKLAIQHQHENQNAIADKFHEANQQAKDQQHEVAMNILKQQAPEPPDAPEPAEMPQGNGGAE